jgi:hypothetical protein
MKRQKEVKPYLPHVKLKKHQGYIPPAANRVSRS